MKRCIFLLLLCICIAQVVCAQAPLVKMWDKRFGGIDDELLRDFQQTSDGGYILGGYSESGLNGDKTQANWDTSFPYLTHDYWVVKIDSTGNKQWDKRFGGTDTDNLHSLQQTSDGGYILGGESSSDANGDKTYPNWMGANYDFWIVKIDSFGNKLWDQRFGGTGEDHLESIQQTSDGGYILSGTSGSGADGDLTDYLRGYDDYLIIKIDAQGNKEWDKHFGGYAHDHLYFVQQTIDNGYMLGGASHSKISGDKTQAPWDETWDFWIVKVDSNGNKQWDKRFGGEEDDELTALQQTIDRGYILGGWSLSNISGDKSQDRWGYLRDYWMVKIDSNGNKLWDKRYGGTGGEELYSIKQTIDGGYLLAGRSDTEYPDGDKTEQSLGYSNTWIVKTDAYGSMSWNFTVKAPENAYRGYAIATEDGCYVIANSTNGGIGGYKTQSNWDTTEEKHDYWIVKFCDTFLMRCLSLEIIPNSVTAHVACIGASDGAAKVVASGGTLPYTFLWSDGQADDSPIDLPAGAHSVTVTDANGCTATTSISIGEGTEPCVGIQQNSLSNITLHPNPTSNTITLTATNIPTQATLTLVDALGKAVLQQSAQPHELIDGVTLDLSKLPEGVYFLRISATGGNRAMKVVRY